MFYMEIGYIIVLASHISTGYLSELYFHKVIWIVLNFFSMIICYKKK